MYIYVIYVVTALVTQEYCKLLTFGTLFRMTVYIHVYICINCYKVSPIHSVHTVCSCFVQLSEQIAFISQYIIKPIFPYQ